MRVTAAPFDDGYYVQGAQAARVGKEGARTAVPVFHRPAECLRLCRSNTFLAGARSLRSTAGDDKSNLIMPIQPWDGRLRAE